MSLFIAYDGESFESAVLNTLISNGVLLDHIEYAFHDWSKGFVDHFQIYNDVGEIVFESLKRAV